MKWSSPPTIAALAGPLPPKLAPSVSHIQGYDDNTEEVYVIYDTVNGVVKQQQRNPNKRRNLHDPSITYLACGTMGQKARACGKLAHSLFLHKYMTDPRNRLICKEVLDEWALKNKPRDDESKKIATAYACESSIYYDRLAEELS